MPRLEEPTDDILEQIVNTLWHLHGEAGKSGAVELLEVHRRDAVNCVMSGTVDHDGNTYGFQIADGNWNGTEVLKWGDPEEIGIYNPGPPPEPATFIPKEQHLTENKHRVYMGWRKQSWFIEKARGLNYDRHFQPGLAVERHYREWAESKGLQIGLLSEYLARRTRAVHSSTKEVRP